RIRKKAKGWQLKDDGSGIGTRVNGKPVYAKTLYQGDVIEAGGLRCVFLSRRSQRPAAPEPEIEEIAPPRARASGGVPTAWVVGAVAVIAVAVLALMLLKDKRKEEEANRLWKQANLALDASRSDADAAKKLGEARGYLERIEAEYRGSQVAPAASGALEDVRRAQSALDIAERERRRASSLRSPAEIQELLGRLARLRIGAHPAVVQRVERIEFSVREDAAARLEEAYSAVSGQARTLFQKKQFADAIRAWRDYHPADYSFQQRAKRAREALAKDIGKDYRKMLALAVKRADLDSRIDVLEAARPLFKGTEQADDLEVRIAALRARRSQRDMVVVREPKPPRSVEPAKPDQPETVPTGPYTDPPSVVEFVKQRQFAKAAATLKSISRHPDAQVRGEELTILANLMADLAGAVQATPSTFTGVLLPDKKGRGAATAADAAGLTATNRKGESVRVPWALLPAKAFPKLFKQAGFDKPLRLATAVFCDEEELDVEARRRYVLFFKSEQAPTTLTRILARRRGVKAPAEGFELFRNNLVTRATKERVLLLERIEKLGDQARAQNGKRRRAAWTELASLGAPAVETLTLTLTERRKVVTEELQKSSAFKPTRFAMRLGNPLREARKNALAFIRDPKLYPYPNKTKESQERAEKLVQKVRDIWDHPYQALLKASAKATELDTELQELDDRLAKVDPLAVPAYEGAVESVEKGLDVRMIAIDGRDKDRIDYNVTIETYNRDLPDTTADAEERANVHAVNRYRWMMGLRSVKIDERLVRAARKHSIEMRQLSYFAHDSPTPHLRSPTHRARREGYPGGVAENIARGASSGVQAFEQWFGSSGHHRNMLSPGHTELGCGAAMHHWWTQKFGRATGRSLNPPKVPPDPDPPGESGNGKPAPK
ncbi:MAG: CAP domain-containing protein, partial [Planctomycetota bacterium]|nr:CAP domain-containing protein [Planctomycetota bacterium]